MTITCKSKSITAYGFSSFGDTILCRVRCSFDTNLTDEEKLKIVRSFSTKHNVPEKYSEMNSFIRKVYFDAEYHSRKELSLVTKGDGKSFVEMIVDFRNPRQFDRFIQKANLIAEIF